MEAPARPHRRLIWKYAAVVVTLVAAAIVSVGLTELYFSYQDSKRRCTRVERDKASSAATSIEQLMRDILRELDAVAQPTVDTGPRGWRSGNRTSTASSITRSSSASSATWTRPGRSASAPRRSRSTGPDSGIDLSRSAEFLRARADQRYLGRVYFQRGSRPHMTISVAEHAAGTRRRGGRHRPELRPRRRSTGRASGRRAMRTPSTRAASSSPTRTSISSSGIRASRRFRRYEPRCAGRRRPRRRGDDRARPGRDEGAQRLRDGRAARLASLRRGAARARRSRRSRSAIWRTALLLVAFLVLAIATSVLLARRLVRPIESIQVAAAKIGSGALDQRIEIPSNDELGALAEEFNRMAARLEESYAEPRAEGRGADPGARHRARRARREEP